MFAAARATVRLSVLVLLATICLTLIGSTAIAVATIGQAVAAATTGATFPERNHP